MIHGHGAKHRRSSIPPAVEVEVEVDKFDRTARRNLRLARTQVGVTGAEPRFAGPTPARRVHSRCLYATLIVVFVTTSDTVELWWEREGDGPVVLLVPGRGDPSDLFPELFTDRLRFAA